MSRVPAALRSSHVQPEPTGYGRPAPNACTHIGWTEERVEKLKALWAEGLSASQVATKLGGVTRSAVIGKVLRLKLDGRDKPSVPRAPRKRAPERPIKLRVVGPTVFHDAEARPPRAVPPPGTEGPGRVTLLDAKPRDCRWPIGDPQADDFTFCGAHAEEGHPYCGDHEKVAYQPRPAKTRTANGLMRSLRRYA